MEKKSIKSQEIFTSEEEKTLVWENVQSSFEKNFGTEVYSSWLKNISLLKEYNDYLVLGVPTRFFRDWIVSRYLDKILSQLKTFKNSINRVEFKISEENKINSLDNFKLDDLNKVTRFNLFSLFRSNLISEFPDIFRNISYKIVAEVVVEPSVIIFISLSSS